MTGTTAFCFFTQYFPLFLNQEEATAAPKLKAAPHPAWVWAAHVQDNKVIAIILG